MGHSSSRNIGLMIAQDSRDPNLIYHASSLDHVSDPKNNFSKMKLYRFP